MSDVDPLAQSTVEQNLSELGAELRKITADQYKATRHAAQCRYAHRVARARAYLASEGTVAEREAHAEVACAEQMRERELAEAVERSLAEAGRNVRAQLEGQRSLLVGIRAAIDYSSGRGG